MLPFHPCMHARAAVRACFDQQPILPVEAQQQKAAFCFRGPWTRVVGVPSIIDPGRCQGQHVCPAVVLLVVAAVTPPLACHHPGQIGAVAKPRLDPAPCMASFADCTRLMRPAEPVSPTRLMHRQRVLLSFFPAFCPDSEPGVVLEPPSLHGIECKRLQAAKEVGQTR